MMDDATDSPSLPDDAALDITLRPFRSLSARGFLILMTILVAASMATGVAFFLIGAWPVPGFLGLDVALVYIAFRANYRRASAWERVRLTRDALTVERGAPGRETRHWSFQPYWLRVEGDERHLSIASHGKSFELGAFLSDVERLRFAASLRAALQRIREAPRIS
jgi:uncharacterized membrane protein